MHTPQISQTKDSFVYRPGKGAVRSGPNDIPEFDNVLRSLSSQGIVAQTKISVMQQAIANAPR